MITVKPGWQPVQPNPYDYENEPQGGVTIILPTVELDFATDGEMVYQHLSDTDARRLARELLHTTDPVRAAIRAALDEIEAADAALGAVAETHPVRFHLREASLVLTGILDS